MVMASARGRPLEATCLHRERLAGAGGEAGIFARAEVHRLGGAHLAALLVDLAEQRVEVGVGSPAGEHRAEHLLGLLDALGPDEGIRIGVGVSGVVGSELPRAAGEIDGACGVRLQQEDGQVERGRRERGIRLERGSQVLLRRLGSLGLGEEEAHVVVRLGALVVDRECPDERRFRLLEAPPARVEHRQVHPRLDHVRAQLRGLDDRTPALARNRRAGRGSCRGCSANVHESGRTPSAASSSAMARIELLLLGREAGPRRESPRAIPPRERGRDACRRPWPGADRRAPHGTAAAATPPRRQNARAGRGPSARPRAPGRRARPRRPPAGG